MGYRGMHVVDADAHYLEEIRDFVKYLKGPAAERFADWSGQYHMPALVGDQYDVMLHGRTVRGAEAGKGDQDEMLGMSSPADLPFLSDAGRPEDHGRERARRLPLHGADREFRGERIDGAEALGGAGVRDRPRRADSPRTGGL